MPLVVARDSESGQDRSAPDCIEIGLVNNMPDAALEATEQQFIRLLESAAGDIPVRLNLFSLPLVPRGDRGQRHLGESYLGLRDFWDCRLDALIVTGTEPRAAALVDEPYWPAMAELIDWAEHHTISTIWSCLAAHAAVFQLDRIRRHPLADKCFGVFDCTAASGHALTEGLAPRFAIPHSRWNALREDELVARGYEILTRSAQAGVDTFARHGSSLFVFCQGHPEYDATSLLGEYRRDVGRFLRRERETCPALPHGAFDAATVDLLNDFRARAVAGRNEALLAEFPLAAAERGALNGWRSTADRIYRNWLAGLATEKLRLAGTRVSRPWRHRPEPLAGGAAPESYIDRRRRRKDASDLPGAAERRSAVP
jgi:homoserine O-succinyltransferase